MWVKFHKVTNKKVKVWLFGDFWYWKKKNPIQCSTTRKLLSQKEQLNIQIMFQWLWWNWTTMPIFHGEACTSGAAALLRRLIYITVLHYWDWTAKGKLSGGTVEDETRTHTHNRDWFLFWMAWHMTHQEVKLPDLTGGGYVRGYWMLADSYKRTTNSRKTLVRSCF